MNIPAVPLFETFTQTLLQLDDPTLLQPLTTCPRYAHATVAMTRLITLLDQLHYQLPEPLAVEDWAPYVQEEAFDVLEALSTAFPDASAASDPAQCPVDRAPWQIMESLMAQLLWKLVHSRYSMMRLLEGVSAQRYLGKNPDSQPSADAWEAGMVRLVATLELKSAIATQPIDLATHRLVPTLLSPTTVLRSPERNLPFSMDQSLMPIQAILDQAEQWLATQDLQPFFQGVNLWMLMPSSQWQSGQLRLHLGLEFTPTTQILDQSSQPLEFQPLEFVEAELLDEGGENSGNSSVNPAAIAFAVQPSDSDDIGAATLIRWSPKVWPFTVSEIADFALQATIAQLALIPTEQLWTEEAVLPVIQAAIAASKPGSEPRPDDPAEDPATVGTAVLLIDELIPKVLWHLTRISYSLTELIQGQAVRLFQPDTDWQTGTLRLVSLLQIQAPSTTWHLDLTMGQFQSPEAYPPRSESIYQPIAQTHLQSIAQHSDEVLQWVRRDAPELAPLLEGIAIEWLDRHHTWQPAQLRLQLTWEFTPGSDILDPFGS